MPSTLGIVASAKQNVPLIPMTGLQGWWDADDASTFSFSSGNIVSQWRDKSGNNRHGGVVTRSALLRNGTLNGRTTCTSDGSRGIDIPQWAMPQPYTTIAVARLAAGETAQRNCIQTHPDGRIYATGTTGYVAIYNSSAGIAHPTAQWGTSAHVVAALFNGASSSINVDGGSAAVGTVSSTGPIVGGNLQTPGPENWVGDLAEFIIYDKALSTVERQQVEQYLKTKWGTP